MNMTVDWQNHKTLHVVCPHCGAEIEVSPFSLNCAIFRHGALIDTLEPIDPHAPRELCEWFVENRLIYGCGKPFTIMRDASGVVSAIKCGYV
jgi:hypothetical protein